MTDICKLPSSSDPLLRIYKTELRFNGAASRMLESLVYNSQGNIRVRFTYDSDESRGEKKIIYVGPVASNESEGYPTIKRGRTLLIHSTELCRMLASNLEGTGTYRICNGARLIGGIFSRRSILNE